MKITAIQKTRISDSETGYWAEYDWNSQTKNWWCRDGNSSSGFFQEHPEMRKVISEKEMLLLMLKYSGNG